MSGIGGDNNNVGVSGDTGIQQQSTLPVQQQIIGNPNTNTSTRLLSNPLGMLGDLYGGDGESDGEGDAENYTNPSLPTPPPPPLPQIHASPPKDARGDVDGTF